MKATQIHFNLENIIADWTLPIDVSNSYTFPNRFNANLSYSRKRIYVWLGPAWMQGDTTKADRIFKK